MLIVCPLERRLGLPTGLFECDGIQFLGVQSLNLQKTSVIEKGIGQVLIDSQFTRAVSRILPSFSVDLVLYSTPPITFNRVIYKIKNHYPKARTYLLLKDIFPQNAIDIGLMSYKGPSSVLYRWFRKKEKRLYKFSDYIGCMSPANVRFVLEHNPEIASERVEVAPNSIELIEPLPYFQSDVRRKFGIPIDLPVFIYGGNLGKPQGIEFLLECLAALSARKDCHFIVVGSGTELPKLKKWYKEFQPSSITVLDGLPKSEYDELVRACDVGLIFLDHRFTIPNYPSRLLSYLENRMPIIAATDPNTDIGAIAEANGYGYWCESNDVEAFIACVDKMLVSDIKTMGEKGYDFLKNNYLVEHTYAQIMKHFQ